jgi:hypothetical protein
MRYPRRTNREDAEASGASAARNKLAAYLREHGVNIPRLEYPPEDLDFLLAIYAWAASRGAALPEYDRIMEAQKTAETENQKFLRVFNTPTDF